MYNRGTDADNSLSQIMFLSNFKRTLQSLPTQEDGYAAFMAHIERPEEGVADAAMAFLTRVTIYSLRRIGCGAPLQTPLLRAPIVAGDLNPHAMIAAIAVTRFPVETLERPEEPIPFTLLTRAHRLLLAVDRVLHEHSPSEDDAADDLLPDPVAIQFLSALEAYRDAWDEWARDAVATQRRSLQDSPATELK